MLFRDMRRMEWAINTFTNIVSTQKTNCLTNVEINQQASDIGFFVFCFLFLFFVVVFFLGGGCLFFGCDSSETVY